MTIRYQFYKRSDGLRLLTYGIWTLDGKLIGYSACFCKAMAVVAYLENR